MQVGLQALKQSEEMDPLAEPPLHTLSPLPSPLRPAQGGQSCTGGRMGFESSPSRAWLIPGESALSLDPKCATLGPGTREKKALRPPLCWGPGPSNNRGQPGR